MTEAPVPLARRRDEMDKSFYCCGSASADWCTINCVPIKRCYIDHLKTKDQAPVYILIGGPLASETRRINNDLEQIRVCTSLVPIGPYFDPNAEVQSAVYTRRKIHFPDNEGFIELFVEQSLSDRQAMQELINEYRPMPEKDDIRSQSKVLTTCGLLAAQVALTYGMSKERFIQVMEDMFQRTAKEVDKGIN